LKFEERENVTFANDGYLLLEHPLVHRRRSSSSEDDYTIKCITKVSPPFANNYKALQRVSISYRHCLAKGEGCGTGSIVGTSPRQERVQDGHALPRAARPPAHDVNGCFFVHYSALQTFPWISWTPVPCRPQQCCRRRCSFCCWLLLCPCTTSWHRARRDSCILSPVTTQMRCLTWEGPCHTRNRFGHVVTL